jgi:hypothetical protein
MAEKGFQGFHVPAASTRYRVWDHTGWVTAPGTSNRRDTPSRRRASTVVGIRSMAGLSPDLVHLGAAVEPNGTRGV